MALSKEEIAELAEHLGKELSRRGDIIADIITEWQTPPEKDVLEGTLNINNISGVEVHKADGVMIVEVINLPLKEAMRFARAIVQVSQMIRICRDIVVDPVRLVARSRAQDILDAIDKE